MTSSSPRRSGPSVAVAAKPRYGIEGADLNEESRVERGSCTLIVARVGAVDPSSDLALMSAVEAEAGLPTGTLVRSGAMDAPEFRLIEAVSRPVADRLAGIARQRGYRPRVRDRLGIKWSSERGGEMAVGFLVAWGLFWLTLATVVPWLDGVFRAGVLLLTIPALVGFYQWQLNRLYMPLVVSAMALPRPVPTVGDALSEAAHEALDGIGRLTRALESGALPSFAERDLKPLIDQLRHYVEARLKEARRLDARSQRAVSAVQARMASLGPDASPEDLARVESLLGETEAEEAELDDARHTLAGELVLLKQLAVDAVDALQGEGTDLSAVERLRQVATDSGDRRQDARTNQVRGVEATRQI